MFEQATRQKLRFEFRGLISVEELWDLSLSNLNKIYKQEKAKLKEMTNDEDSLLDVKSTESKQLELKIEIIKHVFNTLKAEKEKEELRKANSEKKQKILELIQNKKNKEFEEKSIEELEKELEELN
jgi:hypothetical protein